MESATKVEAAPAVIEATTKPLNKESSDDLENQSALSQNKESEEMPKEVENSDDSSESYESEEEEAYPFIFPPQPRPTSTGGSRTLFVCNLPFQVEKSDIEAFFKEAGEVVDVRFAMNKDDGSFKGYGHVEFASSEEAEKALEFYGRPLLGRAIRLDVAAERRSIGVNTPQSGNNIVGNFRSGEGITGDGDGNAPPIIPPSNL